MGHFLFSLIPRSDAAARIVKDNPAYVSTTDWGKALCFEAEHRSRFPGRLASFGRLEKLSDVVLRDDGLAQLQCSFALTTSGELILEDHTTGHHTDVDFANVPYARNFLENYCMRGDPRRLVIPRVDAMPRISFGRNILFDFAWAVLPTDPAIQDAFGARLARIGRDNVAPGRGMQLTVHRGYGVTDAPGCAKGDRGDKLMGFHHYKELGSGSFGRTRKMVDLKSGALMVVKHSRPLEDHSSASTERWKTETREWVDKLTTIRHPHLLPILASYGWEGGSPLVTLCFPVHRGNLRDLVPEKQKCTFPPETPQWIGAFIDHSFSCLAWLHKNDMAHSNLKPENILYDIEERPGRRDKLTFHLSEFGFFPPPQPGNKHKRNSHKPGNMYWLAPEVTRRGEVHRASDLYSFGMILLEVLGFFCPADGQAEFSVWIKKIKRFSSREADKYVDVVPKHAVYPNMQDSHSRVQWLVKWGRVHGSVRGILREDFIRRPSAEEARRDLLSELDRERFEKEREQNEKKEKELGRKSPTPVIALTPPTL